MNKILEWVPLVTVLLGNFAILIKMWVQLETILKWKILVDTHIMDHTRHIDPHRDERRLDEISRRLDKIEGKLDNLRDLEINRHRTGDNADD